MVPVTVKQASFPALEEKQICGLAEKESVNTEICLKTSCDACTSTVMLDGETTCTWYTHEDENGNSFGWCGTGGCDMENCGSNTGPSAATTTNPLANAAAKLAEQPNKEAPTATGSVRGGNSQHTAHKSLFDWFSSFP